MFYHTKLQLKTYGIYKNEASSYKFFINSVSESFRSDGEGLSSYHSYREDDYRNSEFKESFLNREYSVVMEEL